MRPAAALLLAMCFAAAPASAAQDPEPDAGPVAEVPRSFIDCASGHRRGAEDPESERRFDCTRAYFESLPGSEGSTLDMAAAANRAAETADLYIDTILLPAILEAQEPEAGDASPGLARIFLLRSYLRSARAAGETLCDLHYEANSGGTIRSVIAGSCAVENRDRLIGDLIGFAGGAPAE